MPGSSPRGRGKHRSVAGDADRWGLIPAWAGKTVLIVVWVPLSSAHPRVGGENRMWWRLLRLMVGSSPRGRGKRCPATAIRRDRRLIPAWAGKTAVGPVRGVGCQAHPRVGGENSGLCPCAVVGGGSSPRGRGKRPAQPVRGRQRRLIPAWAGKTARPDNASGVPAAHPRVGGENCVAWTRRRSTRGSSPRGRGKRLVGLRRQHAPRLIPAWAGKTYPETRRCRAT